MLATVSAGAFVGSLLAVLVLIALPVLLLGTVAPWALRLAIDNVDEAIAYVSACVTFAIVEL